MILLKPVLTGPNSINITEIKERMAMMRDRMHRIKVKKLWGLSLHQRIKEKERRAERHRISNISVYA